MQQKIQAAFFVICFGARLINVVSQAVSGPPARLFPTPDCHPKFSLHHARPCYFGPSVDP